jgi:hypothetical protein
MDITKEALQYVVELRPPTIHTDSQKRDYTDKPLHAVMEPAPGHIEVSTLSGLKDLLHLKIENMDWAKVLVLVESHEKVSVVSQTSDLWGRRQTFATAELVELPAFRFGQFLDHESFLIGVMAHFTNTADRDYLQQISSHIAMEKVRTAVDDGVSQEVTLKSGASMKANATIRNRVALAPFRTFREIDQPVSEFLFRLRGGDEKNPPTLALFEADGGKWQIDAMESIGRYLRTVVPQEVQVVI